MPDLIFARVVDVCGAITMARVIMAVILWLDAPRKSRGNM